MNQEKSKIFRGSDRSIKYLGMYLKCYNFNKIKWRKDGISTDEVEEQILALQAQAISNVQLRAPIDLMLKRLVNRGLAKKCKDGTVRGTAYIK